MCANHIGSGCCSLLLKFHFLAPRYGVGNTSHTFHDVLDYMVGFISTKLKGKLVYYPLLISYFTVMARCGWCVVWAQKCIEWNHLSKEPRRFAKCHTPLADHCSSAHNSDCNFFFPFLGRMWFSVLLQETKWITHLWRFFTAYEGSTQTRICGIGDLCSGYKSGSS